MTSLTQHLAVDADTAFRTVIDISRLPEWNGAVTRVVDHPANLVPGAEWVVEVTALGQTWPSRSRLQVLDQETRHFAYRSCSDDGNPSYAEWAWTVRPSAGGCEVTVDWSLNPKSFWRRVLLAKIRAYQLKRSEVPASLRSLEDACKAQDGRQSGTGRSEDGAHGG